MKNLCPICYSNHYKSIFESISDNRGNSLIDIASCRDCKHVYLYNWEKYEANNLYDYYSKRIGQKKEDLYDVINRKRYEEKLKEFKKFHQGKQILDVGSGQGHFVYTCLENNYEAMGIELSGAAVKLCHSLNLPVYKIDLFSGEISGKQFDIITMFEVIEHVPNPCELIKKASELLVKEGLLFLTTPNYLSFDRFFMGSDWRVFNREHINYFKKDTLLKIVSKQANLHILYCKTENLNPYVLKHFLVRKFGRTGKNNEMDDERNYQSALRANIERSPGKNKLKMLVNLMLQWTNLGSKISILCQKK